MVLLDKTVGLRSPALYTPKRSYQAHGHLWRCATERGSREVWVKRRHHLDLFSRNWEEKFIANSLPSASIAS
jgi:hypothetical protein